MRKSSIYLPDELKTALGDLAIRTGRSEADLIRHAIERLVALAEGPAPGTAAPWAEGSTPSGSGPSGSGAAAPALVNHPRPALVGVGVGPGDPGLVTARARATLLAADRVLVISTDARSVGRAEMVVRAVAPTSRVQRVPFAISGGDAARAGSLRAVRQDVLAAVDAGDLVALAVLGDPSQWSLFPELRAEVAAQRPGLHISAEAGITSYQAAAAQAGVTLGCAEGALVVTDRVGELGRHLKSEAQAVVLYKASTDAATIRAAAAHAGRGDAVVAELSGMPGQRLVPLAELPDGPIAYLTTVVFPAGGRPPA